VHRFTRDELIFGLKDVIGKLKAAREPATIYFPGGFGKRTTEWVTVYDQDGIVVQIATAETLLAMKLNAATARGRREIADLALLLGLCRIDNVDDAEDHFGDYYSEELNDRAVRAVEAALAVDTTDMTAEDLNLEED